MKTVTLVTGWIAFIMLSVSECQQKVVFLELLLDKKICEATICTLVNINLKVGGGDL